MEKVLSRDPGLWHRCGIDYSTLRPDLKTNPWRICQRKKLPSNDPEQKLRIVTACESMDEADKRSLQRTRHLSPSCEAVESRYAQVNVSIAQTCKLCSATSTFKRKTNPLKRSFTERKRLWPKPRPCSCLKKKPNRYGELTRTIDCGE